MNTKAASSANLLTICLIAFFSMSGGALLGPVLPAMVEPLNTTRELIGMVLGIYTFATAISMILIASVVDRFGRKTILIPCLLLNGAAGMGAYFTHDLDLLLALRLIQGIGVAGMLPIAMTMIGELYTGLDRVHAMGRMSMTTAIGAVSAPLIGGSMAAITWNTPFLFYGLMIPLAIVAMLILPETNSKGMKKKTGFLEMFRPIRDIRVAHSLLLSFVIFFLLYTIVIYVPFILKDSFGFTAKGAGIALGIQGTSMALVASQAKRMSRRFPQHAVIASGFIISAMAVAGLAVADSLPQTVALLLMFGAGFGAVQPFLNTLVTQVAPEGHMGSVVSLFNTMKYAGQTAAPAVLAMVLIRSDLQTAFIVSSILGLIAASSIYLAKKDDFKATQGHSQ